MSALSRVLARLAERRVRGDFTSAGPVAVSVEVDRVGVESFLPGGVLENSYGRVYLHERLRSEIEKPTKKWGKYACKPSTRVFLHEELEPFATLGASSTVFFDLETCGLSVPVVQWITLRLPEWVKFHIQVNDVPLGRFLASNRFSRAEAARTDKPRVA